MSAIVLATFCLLLALVPAGWGAPVVTELPRQQSPVTTVPRSNLRIVLYSTSWCPHCREAKEYFKKHDIAYINKDVEQDSDAMEALVETYKSTAVPVIVIGNDEKILKGFVPEVFEKALAEVKGKK